MLFDEIMSDGLKFELEDDFSLSTKIKVIGVGGGGGNAVARMMGSGLVGVEFHVLNTDKQALQASPVPHKLAIGSKITNGLGAGADPRIGRQAALEDTDKIIEILEGADMVFVTAGLGGGTGTGAAPVVASLAKEMGALTVAVVTKPFDFEGVRRKRAAEFGLGEIAGAVDTVIPIPNERLLKLAPKQTGFFEAFKLADDVLHQAVQGISDIITTPGLINRDFSDIKGIMTGMGYAMMGTARARGENAALLAAEQAISSPLLEEGGVKGARGILINITGSSRLGLHEVNEACSLIRQAAAFDDVHINFGVVLNEAMEDEVKITVIATGFERETLPHIERRVQQQQQQVIPVFEEVRARPMANAAAAGSTFNSNAFTAFQEPRIVMDAMPQDVHEPEVFMPTAEDEIIFHPVAQAQPEPQMSQPPTPPSAPAAVADDEDDYDTPAFLKRERRLFQ